MRRNRAIKRELREEAVEKKAGACNKCNFNEELIVRFPSEGLVTRMTGDNASVRVICSAVGGQEVRTVQVTKPKFCHRWQRKYKKLEKKRAERKQSKRVSVFTPRTD